MLQQLLHMLWMNPQPVHGNHKGRGINVFLEKPLPYNTIECRFEVYKKNGTRVLVDLSIRNMSLNDVMGGITS